MYAIGISCFDNNITLCRFANFSSIYYDFQIRTVGWKWFHFKEFSHNGIDRKSIITLNEQPKMLTIKVLKIIYLILLCISK